MVMFATRGYQWLHTRGVPGRGWVPSQQLKISRLWGLARASAQSKILQSAPNGWVLTGNFETGTCGFSNSLWPFPVDSPLQPIQWRDGFDVGLHMVSTRNAVGGAAVSMPFWPYPSEKLPTPSQTHVHFRRLVWFEGFLKWDPLCHQLSP